MDTQGLLKLEVVVMDESLGDELVCSEEVQRKVLAVDLGLKLGLALYEERGDLLWYRSQHFATRAKLKDAVWRLLREVQGLHTIVLEGDRGLGSLFSKAARKQEVAVLWVSPKEWRCALMPARHRRSGADAKAYADELARAIIERSGAKRPTSLRHDAAEAILIGQWALSALGWCMEG